MQVDREHVEVLVLLGEEQPAEGHVAAGLGDGQLEVLAHEVAAEQRRQPVAVGVAPDADEARRDVVHLARAPVLELGEAAARAVLQVQLERARVQRLALAKSSARSYSCSGTRCPRRRRTSVRAYCATPGPLDRVDDLERVLDDDALGHVQEGAAGPERGVGGLELVAVDRQALGVPALGQLAVLAEGLLQRAQDHAALGQRGVELDVHDRARALHDPPGARAVGQRARDDVGHDAGLDLAVAGSAGLERVEVEALQARRPEPRAPPHGQLRGLVRLQRRLAQLLERAPVAGPGARERVVEGRLAVAAGLDLDGVGSRRRAARQRATVERTGAPTSWRIWS